MPLLPSKRTRKKHIGKRQKPYPLHINKKTCKSIDSITSLDKENELDMISKTFKQLFPRIGKIKNQTKITHFHEPLKPIQLKGRRVPLHLLDSVKTELNRLKSEGHIKKLENCDEDRFISPIVITCKKDKSIKLALDSNFINKQIQRTNFRRPTYMN